MAAKLKEGLVSRLLKTLSLTGHTPRASERNARDNSVYLFSDTTFIGQANLIDESEGGAKVSSPTPDIMRRARYLLDPNTASVNTVTLAWSSGREAGFQYTARRRLRGYIDDPKIEHIQAYWNSIAASASVGVSKGVFGRVR